MELGLGAGFQADVEFLAVAHYLLYYRANLVNLDGIDKETLAIVAILLGCRAETVGDFLHTVVEDVGETKEHRRCDILHLKLVEHLAKINRGQAGTRSHADVTFFIDGEILPAPPVDVVELDTVLHSPFSHSYIKNMWYTIN